MNFLSEEVFQEFLEKSGFDSNTAYNISHGINAVGIYYKEVNT